MTTIYFDTCSLQRPLDDKTQVRIALEAEAMLAVLTVCENGAAALVASDVLLFEINRNPHPQRKAFASGVIAQHTHFVPINDAIQQHARHLAQAGFTALDALHLASAQYARVDLHLGPTHLISAAQCCSGAVRPTVAPLQDRHHPSQHVDVSCEY